MTNQHEYIAQLIKKWLDDTLTDQEATALDRWVEQQPTRRTFIESLHDQQQLLEQIVQWIELEHTDSQSWGNRLEETTLQKIQQTNNLKRKGSVYQINWKFAAAMVLLAAGSALLIFSLGHLELSKPQTYTSALSGATPGIHQASITLPEGTVIPLSQQQQQLVVGADKQLYYENNIPLEVPHGPLQASDELTLQVPRAGRYSVKLVDGTTVWLNSQSTLKFPVAFAENIRSVCLQGEAYFDVRSKLAENQQKTPFFVQTDQQRIEVKGTRFNVNAFQGKATKTTLVEGEVLVHSEAGKLQLLPGERSINNQQSLTKSAVQVKTETAWKDNLFYFDETPMQEAMEQLSRWYDIQVIYGPKGIPDTYFYGEFSRSQPLNEILTILEEAGIKFKYDTTNDKNNLYVIP